MSSQPSLQEIDAEIKELQHELLRLSILREQDLKSKALEYFIPSPKQLKFFQNADKPNRYGFCGNRFGKTTVGVVEDCCWLLGERPFFDESNPLRRLGIPVFGVKLLVLCEDWDKVHDLFTNKDNLDRPGKFFEFLPEDKIKSVTRMQKGVINSITVTNTIDGVVRESVVIFDTVRSFVNNPRSFESSDWDAIHVDEPIMQDLWSAVSRGLIDRGGFTWWLMTPLGFPWMYEHAVEMQQKDPERHWLFEASMDDNPTLDQSKKEEYIAQLPEDERECRRLGKPLAFGRRVYGFYDEKVHVWNKPELPDKWRAWNVPPMNFLSGYAIDPHPQTPHAVLFVSIAPDGTVYIYDEIFEKCMISELATKVLERRNRVRCGWELCDPFAWINNPDTNSCWADTLMEYGLGVIRASKEKSAGVIQTQQIFSPTFKQRVIVMPHCTRFRKEIKSYFFDKENKPVDKDDHMMENLYRIVLHTGLRWYPDTRQNKPIVPKDIFANVGNDSGYLTNYNL